MLINGLSSSAYPVERTPVAPGRALAPYEETQRIADRGTSDSVSGETASQASTSAQQSESSSSATSITSLSARFEATMSRPVSTRVAEALASYASTASFRTDFDSHDVLGLDLYA
ncbi:hypothetical protein HW090_02610 [Pseudomonas sp. ABC1]|uniref:hypothetical protein n=1 Tax=Pseudomonas sp. ABC1 TaxID=2748080 RepID=UPI0015C369EB|nr:hypothetical protein [Pseudomonas sp. ABC1]QLF92154.1 hypothetical protein HW090_02610 [Pseudomonas sp. ABC1]